MVETILSSGGFMNLARIIFALSAGEILALSAARCQLAPPPGALAHCRRKVPWSASMAPLDTQAPTEAQQSSTRRDGASPGGCRLAIH